MPNWCNTHRTTSKDLGENNFVQKNGYKVGVLSRQPRAAVCRRIPQQSGTGRNQHSGWLIAEGLLQMLQHPAVSYRIPGEPGLILSISLSQRVTEASRPMSCAVFVIASFSKCSHRKRRMNILPIYLSCSTAYEGGNLRSFSLTWWPTASDEGLPSVQVM